MGYFELDALLTFMLASLLLSVSPGPSNLYIMARTINAGQASGVSAASGMALGSMTFVLLTAFGLATVFSYSAVAFTTLKLVGAGYLIYLGYQTFRQAHDVQIKQNKLNRMTPSKVFLQSIIVELTNPKTALFFLAFLPQFVNLEAGSVAVQLMVLGIIYTSIAFTSDLVVVVTSNQLGKLLATNPILVQVQDYLSGTILVGLGALIAYEEVG